MSNAPRTTYISFHQDSRSMRDWSLAGKGKVSGRTMAKNHAKKNGAAGVLFADGSYTLFFMDQGKLRSKTWKQVSVMNLTAWPFGFSNG